MQTKMQNKKRKVLTPEEQKAADEAKAAKAAARKQSVEESMHILHLFGIKLDAFKYVKQGRCPQPEVTAAISLLSLTLVFDILRRSIEKFRVHGKEEAAEEDDGPRPREFRGFISKCKSQGILTDAEIRKAWQEAAQKEPRLSLGLWERKPCHDILVRAFHTMVFEAKEPSGEIAQRPELIQLLMEAIRCIFNPDFVNKQKTPAKKATAKNIRSKMMEKFEVRRNEMGRDGHPQEWDSLYTEKEWQTSKEENRFFAEAEYGEEKGQFNKKDFHLLVVMVFTMTTKEESTMDCLSETKDPLDPKWFDGSKARETFVLIVDELLQGLDMPDIEIKISKAGLRQLLEVIMHTLWKWFDISGQMATHRNLARLTAGVDQRAATMIIGKEGFFADSIPPNVPEEDQEGNPVPPPAVTTLNLPGMQKYMDSMQATLQQAKASGLFEPTEEGPFSEFI